MAAEKQKGQRSRHLIVRLDRRNEEALSNGHRVRVSKRSGVLMNACRVIKVTVTRVKCGAKCQTSTSSLTPNVT